MGSLVISIDAELAWGVHDLYPLSDDNERRVSRARRSWSELIDLFDEFSIPATWAIVGHLLVEDSRALRERHPLADEWFERSQIGLENLPHRWLGRRLVDAVRSSDVDHEIGSHSFSHVVFTDVSKEVATMECRLAREVCEHHGLDPRSFVYPRNEIAHRSALSESGFVCYRGHRPRQLPAIPGFRGAAMLTGAVTGAVKPPVVVPHLTVHGLVNIPASLFLGGFRGGISSVLSATDTDPAIELSKLGIDRACEQDGVFHLWLHPNDLTNRSYVDRIRRVLSYAATKRADRGLRIQTMRSIAQAVNQGEYDV